MGRLLRDGRGARCADRVWNQNGGLLGSLWEYEAEGEPLPETGLKTIVLDGDGDPMCIIETTEVEVRPYGEVDARFAYEEGEGDRSLEYWREAHWRFFSRTLPNIGKEPATDMPLVCERFRVIYR